MSSLGLGLGVSRLFGRGQKSVAEFILQIDTTLGDGLNQMRMPLQSTQPMTIDWGDGTIETVTQTAEPASVNWITHTYASAGIYDIKVSNVDRIMFNNEGDALKHLKVLNWGTYGASQPNQDFAFRGCINLTEISGNGSWFVVVTSAERTFNFTSLILLPTGMTLESLTNGSRMFALSALNTESLSSLYIKMSVLNPNNDVPFHGGSGNFDPAFTEVIDGVTYNTGDARADLVSRGWSLTDGGSI